MLSTIYPEDIPTVDIPVIILVVTPIAPAEFVVTSPTALDCAFTNDSAVVLYVVCLFIKLTAKSDC